MSSRVVQILPLFILIMAKVELTLSESGNMILSKKNLLTRLGKVRFFSKGTYIHDFSKKIEM